MKYIFSILLCAILQTGFSQNIIKTVGISYTAGPPTYTPAKAGSWLALDTVTWKYYTYNGSTWLSDGFRVQTISGCSAPAYTPTKFQSYLVINACTAGQGGPELYFWTGLVWLQINEGQTYTAGTGIAISGANVITNTAPDQTVTMTDGTGIDVTGTYPNFTVTNTSPNVVQTLSIAGQDLTLSNGGGTVTIPGGSGVTAANNGVSLSSTTVQLGDAAGGTSSQFTANRYLPQNNFGLFVGNNAMTSYVRISGDSFATSGILNFKFPAASGTAFSKVINPIVKGTQNTPFYEGISSTTQTGNSPNAVWMAGWNLSPGGAKVEAGKPYIGESWEHNYRPQSPSVYNRLIEKHEIYMPSYSNTQRRLSSYTITESATGSNFIDYYHTVNSFSLRDTSGLTYFGILGNQSSLTAKAVAMTLIAGDKGMRFTVDSLNNTFVINNQSDAATKSSSNFTWTGFREYHFNDYLSRSILQNVSYPTFNDVQFGKTAYQSVHGFNTSGANSGFGVFMKNDALTSTSLATRGNLYLQSGSLYTYFGQRSDINMGYIAVNGGGGFAIRTNALQVGPAAGTSLPLGVTLQVNSNLANTSALQRWQTTTDSVKFFVTSADPNTVITGRVGDFAAGTNGNFYFKATGNNTNTGWINFGGVNPNTFNGNYTSTGAATTAFTVTLPTAQPDATYSVSIMPKNALSATGWYISARTTTTFEVTYLTGLTGAVDFDYIVIN